MPRTRKIEPTEDPLNNMQFLAQDMATDENLAQCKGLLKILSDNGIQVPEYDRARVLIRLVKANPGGRGPSDHVLAARDLIALSDLSQDEIKARIKRIGRKEQQLKNKTTRQALAGIQTHPGAASWLAALANFAPEPIMLALLEEAAKERLPYLYANPNERPLSHYVDEIVTAGFAKYDAPGIVSIPASVAATILSLLDQEHEERALLIAIDTLWAAFPWNIFDQSNFARGERLVNHVLTVAGHAESVPMARRDATVLLYRACNYYQSRREYPSAIAAGRRAVAMGQLSRDDLKLAAASVILAQTLYHKGELDEAESLLLHAIQLETDSGAPPLSHAETLNLYGGLQCRMRRFKKAEKSQREALALLSEERPTEYWIIAIDLGMTLKYQHRFKEALGLLNSAIEHLRGHDKERIARADAAQVLLDLDRPGDAKAQVLTALALQAGRAATDQAFTKDTLKTLHRVHVALGEDAEAREVEQRIAEIDTPWLT
jgi:tetratricopeptide (TPR) repeat protein